MYMDTEIIKFFGYDHMFLAKIRMMVGWLLEAGHYSNEYCKRHIVSCRMNAGNRNQWPHNQDLWWPAFVVGPGA